MSVAYVGLGANLGDPAAQLDAALAALAKLERTRVVRVSSYYRSAPVGSPAQPDFVNAVAELDTALPPRELMRELLDIESRFGRTREFPNAPRTLDLDLLLHGASIIDEPGLEVPHPRMHERAFVLAPLLEIAPRAVIPGKGGAGEWLARCAGQRIQRIEAEKS